MANLSELDLQNLRHLMGGYDVTHCKMKEYAQCASDVKVKQFFEKCDAEQAAVDGVPAVIAAVSLKKRNYIP